MNFFDILLITISSAGLLHGVLLALYLGFLKKKRSLSNKLLSFILIAMGFRIGKSVILNFANHLEVQFIFTGLAVLLLIGPLLRWYILSMVRPEYKIRKSKLIEIIPFLLILVSSFFITKYWLKTGNLGVFWFLGLLLLSYVHLAYYIFLSWRIIQRQKKDLLNETHTKAQEAIIKWLNILVLGFAIIWISYVVNILDDSIPYIIGPIIYSFGVYFLSYKAFNLKIENIDGNVFKAEDDNSLLFSKMVNNLEQEKLYLLPNLSLEKLSKSIGTNSQKTSAIINLYAKKNFNDFVNYYRIQEAKLLLTNIDKSKYTISAIAYDAGFNSVSSFNSAFKKFEGTTPSNYIKNKT